LQLIAGEPTQLTLNSTYKENSLEIDSSLKNSHKDRNDFKITLPLKLSLIPFKLDFIDDENIKGYLNLNLKIDPISALFLPPVHRLKGDLSTKLSVAGSLNGPLLTGNAFIKAGKYEYATAGIKMKNISSHISALGKSVLIKEFTASDGDGGTFNGNGKWELNKKNMPYNIILEAHNYFFLNHPNIQATINGNIKISGHTEQASIKGYIEPILLEIQLPEHFAKDISEINIVETIFVPGLERKVNSKNFLDEYKISTDISLNAKRKIFVRGWGLDAELGGQLTCKGFIEDPVIRGKLEVIRGRYQEFGKQFTLKSGKLNFEDSIPPAPYLDVIGSTIQDDVEIRIILSGPMLKPNLSIESSPTMPKEEVLSTLLFGKQTTQISPFQALQLTDSLRRLSGQGGGSLNILNKARGILKVDDIKIKNNSSDPSDAALGIGKYLTDKVYLEIEKGTQVGSGKTKVEVEIRNNLSIESSVGEAGSNSIGINWRKDY
jgi:translocation and assembly module TamB